MKVKQYKPKDRLFSEQYIIDENGFITIPSTTLFNAGLSSDKKFIVLEKYNANNVYYIVPANFEYDEKEWGYLFEPEVENNELKFSVKGLFDNLKPGDSVTLDIFEFQLLLYDRHAERNNEEEKKETKIKKETGSMKNLFDCFDPYAPDENTIEMMGDNIHKKFSDLDKKLKKQNKITDYNDLIENPPSLEELDKMFGKILKEIVNHSNKQIHRSKDPLLNEFINDMLARVYGRDGQKVVMISSDELDQFIKDMTWWYKRIKKGE